MMPPRLPLQREVQLPHVARGGCDAVADFTLPSVGLVYPQGTRVERPLLPGRQMFHRVHRAERSEQMVDPLAKDSNRSSATFRGCAIGDD
jgi:hypothetical protein